MQMMATIAFLEKEVEPRSFGGEEWLWMLDGRMWVNDLTGHQENGESRAEVQKRCKDSPTCSSSTDLHEDLAPKAARR